jgi:hypothetical protein
MSFPRTQAKGRDFEPIPPGLHLARLVGIYDVGLQRGEYKGERKDTHKVIFKFEIPGFRVKFERDGQEIDAPGIIYQWFTNSISEKANLRQFIESWTSKPLTSENVKDGIPLDKLLGFCGQLNIKHEEGRDGGPRARILNIVPISAEQRDASRKPAESTIQLFTVSEYTQAAYDGLPPFIRKLVDEALPISKMKNGACGPDTRQKRDDAATASQVTDADYNDDIPF